MLNKSPQLTEFKMKHNIIMQIIIQNHITEFSKIKHCGKLMYNMHTH